MKYYDLLTEAYYNNQLDPMAEKVFEEMETERLFGIKDTGDIPSYRRIKKNFNPFEEAPEPARTEAPKRNQPYYPGNTPGYQLYSQPYQQAANMAYSGDQYAFMPGGGNAGPNAPVKRYGTTSPEPGGNGKKSSPQADDNMTKQDKLAQLYKDLEKAQEELGKAEAKYQQTAALCLRDLSMDCRNKSNKAYSEMIKAQGKVAEITNKIKKLELSIKYGGQ